MSESPHDTRQTQFLLTNLIILVIFILALVVLAVAYPTFLAPKPTLTPTITATLRPSATFTPPPTPTVSPTVTQTPRPTLTPTITQSPTASLTPTLTPTPAGPPTLTPARPALGEGVYKMGTWTPEQASHMADLIKDYPNTIPEKARGEDNAAYYAAATYGIVALKEALLRFPDAPQASQWSWDLAYSLAQNGDPEAGQRYADLITQALNGGETDLNSLPDWFSAQEPRLGLYRIELDPPEGYVSSNLLEVRGAGSAFIWLLETPGAFQANVLTSNFDFVHNPQASSIITDLTGDGMAEVAIYASNLPGTLELTPPRVFDLSQAPPRELSFLPSDATFNVGMEFTNYWAAGANPTTGNDLFFRGTAFPACPVTIERQYHWDGKQFALANTGYEVTPGSTTDAALSLCRLVVDHAAQSWGPIAATTIMEKLLPDWPPAQDENGKAFPADAHDEWVYRLGVYQALAGNLEAAQQSFKQVINQPSTPNSQWIAPAQQFLDTYRTPEDIYRACVQAPSCVPAYAIQYLMAHLPAGNDPVEYLWQSGVTLRASGYFDFDQDGETERWFTVRHRPLEKLEFWILTNTTKGPQAVLLDNIESDKPSLEFPEQAATGSATSTPPPVTSMTAAATPPVVWLDGEIAFILQRDPETGMPSLRRVPLAHAFPNRFQAGLQAAEQSLFAPIAPKAALAGVPESSGVYSSTQPSAAQLALLGLQDYPGLLCRGNWSCDRYYYLLGLSSELTDDSPQAVDAYLRLWLDYSKSPFTTMARLKLDRSGLPTATPAITNTPTPTTSPAASSATPATSTLTPTPGGTVTITPVGTSAPGGTPTLTPTEGASTPYP